MQFHKGDVPRLYHPRFLTYEEPYNIEFKYHNYDQMSRFLRATSLRFQNLTALYSIGKSVKGINGYPLSRRYRCLKKKKRLGQSFHVSSTHNFNVKIDM